MILVSDMQAGSQIESLQVYAWPDQLRLDVRPVLARERTNAWATILATGTDSAEDTDRVRVRVSNSADATDSRFRIGWTGGSQSTTGEINPNDSGPGDSGPGDSGPGDERRRAREVLAIQTTFSTLRSYRRKCHQGSRV